MKSKEFDYKKDLAEKLPGLKEVEGFPIGDDRNIIALSEPPYYTACPNPYITDFIEEVGKPYDATTDNYHCEPYVGDVSEGKKDPIYNTHSYHTKVPYKAITPYIEHYTQQNDVIFDGFSGSGMTGVAALLSNRKCILSDLSPVASLISYNYNVPFSSHLFSQRVIEILDETSLECNWMYETFHLNSKITCPINYVVWSDVFLCPFCKSEYVFFKQAINKENGSVLKEFKCPNCDATIKKTDCERVTRMFIDINGEEVFQTKQVPVLIAYEYKAEEYEKEPDEFDFDVIEKIENLNIPYWFPSNLMMGKGSNWGDIWRAGYHLGVTRVNHFYFKRTLYCLSKIYDSIIKTNNSALRNKLLFLFTGSITGLSKQQRYRHKSGFPNMILSGTLYIGSMIKEYHVINWFSGKAKAINRLLKMLDAKINSNNCLISCNSASKTFLPSNSVDYIFTDPPFGDNLMYSELNFIWESWIKVISNNHDEAIINSSQNKSLYEYRSLMQDCFSEFYRILKPKRWITIVFHNSRSSVWNAIQESITRSGFIIARVSILDKQQGSFKQINSPGAVEKDLVISAFKPTDSFEKKFLKQIGMNLEVEFIFQFLFNIPIRPAIERTDKMIYSKIRAYYVQHGYEVNQDAKSFYRLLKNNFIEEDGFWFTPTQIGPYREFKKKVRLEGIEDIKQGSMLLFITDESSALLWLYNFLSEPKTFSQISTAFTQLSEIQGDDVPDLKQMLDENFVDENDKYRRPIDESEKTFITERRERVLMRVFESVLIEAKSSKKKILLVRKEALLYGFETCYKQNRFEDILTVANRLDSSIIENSTELIDFIEIARIKIEGIK
jgi:DNA modification methylase